MSLADTCKPGAKKDSMLAYQQSFRIDDLLRQKAIEQQQPDHFPLSHSSPDTGAAAFRIGPVPQPKLIKSENKKHDPALSFNNSDMRAGIKRGSSSDAPTEDDDDLFQKRKKARTAFSREQVAELEKKFQDKKYLSSNERGELAEKLKLSDMQVKTWFQNRRMKFKRQSEEAEMEMKASKYSFSSFMPYSMYGYMQNSPTTYGYPSSIRSPQTPSAPTVDGAFSQLDMSSPTMLAPLSAGPHRHNGGMSPLIRSAPPSTSYFANGGLLTPISPSSSYQQVYYNGGDSSTAAHAGLGTYHSHLPFVGHDWQRSISSPPVTTP